MDYFSCMRISVTKAKAQLTDLVRRAEAGDEIILTRHGHPAVRLTPASDPPARKDLRAVIADIEASAAARITPGTCAARSQDFLYDEHGLPK